MTEKATRYIPRWLHYRANVSADLTGFVFTEIPPNTFANETIWPYHLEYLAITGFPPGHQFASYFWGGVGNCVNLELGISGVSDINQVTASATTVMGHGVRDNLCPSLSATALLISPYYDGTFTHKLKHPYLLARGNGLNVEFRSTLDDYHFDPITIYRGNPAFAAYGRKVDSLDPVMLAGSFRTTDDPDSFLTVTSGSGVSFGNADLVNDGLSDVLIDTLCFTYPLLNVANVDSSAAHQPMIGLYSTYLVNPINGPKWMPGSDMLPLMGICPGSLPWPVQQDLQPIVHMPAIYEFPATAVINRRQRLNVRLFNRATHMHVPPTPISMPVTVDVTLFGYLEVR
jgi:hypothetical protein